MPPVLAQEPENLYVVELGATNFPIERPFTISVTIPNSENRPVINFPAITGFTKRGTTVSVVSSEMDGKTVTNQVITQTYQAVAPGRYQLPDFDLVINGETVRSEGATLVVRPSATLPVSTTATVPTGAAFLSLRASKSSVYAGENVGLTLSFFVADTYPFELNFTALDKQVQEIVKQIRPTGAWEENLNITELKPIPVEVGGKKFREYRIYQSVFFPLAVRPVQIGSVSLRLLRQPVIGPPALQPESVVFTSKPLRIVVRPLPPHPLRGQVPVGQFRLNETLDRSQVAVGKSVRYTFAITGTGSMATLPAPTQPTPTTDVDLFPPQEQLTINRFADRVIGRKAFTYFIVPHQNGVVSLANRLEWIYFDLQTGRYDTLRPRLTLRVGGAATHSAESETALAGTQEAASAGNAFYAGIDQLDSTRQSVRLSVLIRSIANVLIVAMLLGMVFILIKK